jgi:phenylalanyl-tRNA synthetase beta chain
LLAGHAQVPLLQDATGLVLSLPPIINSEATRVKRGSTRLFIDVTGIESDPVRRALDVLVGSLAEMGATLRTVAIQQHDTVSHTPEVTPRELTIELEACNRWLGLELDAAALHERAARMRLGMRGGPERFTLSYPVYRSDVRHAVDLYEDIAIGHGYRNFALALVPTATVGDERPEEVLSSRARAVMLGLGFDEAMTLMQTTVELHFERMQRAPVGCVRMANARNAAYDVIRTDLLPGLLELLQKNRRKAMPLCLFEIDTTVVFAATHAGATRELRRLAFVVMGSEAGYAEVRAILDSLLFELGWQGSYAATDAPGFLAGRTAQVTLTQGGQMHSDRALLGELHPEVLEAFSLPYPVAACELTLAEIVA